MQKNIPVNRIRRVLIVRPDAIGDMVLTLPVIAALRRVHPHITLIGSRYTYDLVAPTGLFDEILIDKCRTDEARGWRGFWRYVLEIRRLKFDAVVHFYSETPEVWLTIFAGIRYQVGNKAKLGLWPIFRKYGRFLKTFDQTKQSQLRLRLSMDQGPPIQAGSVLESQLCGEHPATNKNSPRIKNVLGEAENSLIGYYRHLFEAKKF